MIKCSICGKEIEGRFGNNPSPLKRGLCCDKCNTELVLPLRLYLAGANKNTALLVEPNGVISYHKVEGDKIKLEVLQEMVEGYIEIYPKQDYNFLFIVNEEGLIYNKRSNKLAYELFGISAVGNVVVLPKNLID